MSADDNAMETLGGPRTRHLFPPEITTRAINDHKSSGNRFQNRGYAGSDSMVTC